MRSLLAGMAVKGGGKEGGMLGRRRVVGLAAIMRSSVFRCRSASPYRYVSSPSRSSPSPCSPATPPREPRPPIWPRSEIKWLHRFALSPIFYFYFGIKFHGGRRDPDEFLRLLLSLFLRKHWWNLSLSRKTFVEAIRS